MTATPGAPRRWRSWLWDNSLSIVFAVLLLAALAGQAVAGAMEYDQRARTAGAQEIGVWGYVATSQFAVDVAENWQSEYLQFALYILLTTWLVQRGSAESKRPEDRGTLNDERRRLGAFLRPDSPAWARAGGWRTRVYAHSLSLTMGLIFVLSWGAQALTGWVAGNEDRMRDRLDPLGLFGYVTGPNFWNRSLQNWQSELLAVGSMVAFSIYLRERDSPESKDVGAPHAETSSVE